MSSDVQPRPRPALGVAGVTKAFRRGPLARGGRIEVLRGASLHVDSGELVGLVGENGSGKSTLMKIIAGLIARDAGEVELAGALGHCPQEPVPPGCRESRRVGE